MPRLLFTLLLAAPALLSAGPYSHFSNDPSNPYDPPVPGLLSPGVVNPAFTAWASSVVSYTPGSPVDAAFSDPSRALGPPTGDPFDIVSLGDLSAAQIAAHAAPGQITLAFDKPIFDGPGPDLAIFENGFDIGDGLLWGELAFVEVSSDGINFARIPSRSLTADPPGLYSILDPTDIFNLPGKHLNAYGQSWGTPINLASLAQHPLVLSGAVSLANIRYIRLVDIPGDGSSLDSTGAPIYDGWPTSGSGGFDLEALGALQSAPTLAAWLQTNLPPPFTDADRDPLADPDHDGLSNLAEYALGANPATPDAPAFTPVPALGADTDAQPALILRYRRSPARAAAAGLQYLPETSTNLLDWQPAAATDQPDPSAPAPSAGEWENRRILIPAPPATTTLFLRLRITRNSP